MLSCHQQQRTPSSNFVKGTCSGTGVTAKNRCSGGASFLPAQPQWRPLPMRSYASSCNRPHVFRRSLQVIMAPATTSRSARAAAAAATTWQRCAASGKRSPTRPRYSPIQLRQLSITTCLHKLDMQRHPLQNFSLAALSAGIEGRTKCLRLPPVWKAVTCYVPMLCVGSWALKLTAHA